MHWRRGAVVVKANCEKFECLLINAGALVIDRWMQITNWQGFHDRKFVVMKFVD